MQVGIDIGAHDRVKPVYAGNGRDKAGMVIMRQETPFIESEAMGVAMHSIKPDNVALIVDVRDERLVGAGEVDPRIVAIFQHEAMIDSGIVAISPDDHSGIVNAAG